MAGISGLPSLGSLAEMRRVVLPSGSARSTDATLGESPRCRLQYSFTVFQYSFSPCFADALRFIQAHPAIKMLDLLSILILVFGVTIQRMKAYLVPGSGEDLKSRDYRAVLNLYKELGYEPEFVSIDWKYKTIDDWVEQVKLKISKQELGDSLLSGFSWGSMIALTLAAEYKSPQKLFLFSLSPYFAEDLPHVKETWLRWAGKRRVAKFKQLSMNKLADRINCPTTIFIGSKEVSKYSDMKRRTKEAHKRIKGSKVIEIDDVRHDVGDPKYVEAIRKELR